MNTVEANHVIATAVSSTAACTKTLHAYTVSPLLTTLGGLKFQLELLIVKTPVAALKVDWPLVGFVGEFPLLATTSE